MSSFTSILRVDKLPGRRWRLALPFCYDVGRLGSGERITVPSGFVTDFASVPRPLWWLYDPAGPWGKAGVVHDYLYSRAGLEVPSTGRSYTRAQCDRIFLEALGVAGIRWTARRTLYRGVRLGGWVAWNSHYRRNERRLAAS